MSREPFQPPRITIRRSRYGPCCYATLGTVVLAYAEIYLQKNGVERAGEVVGSRRFSSLSWEGRRDIVLKLDRMEEGDVGF